MKNYIERKEIADKMTQLVKHIHLTMLKRMKRVK